MKKEIEKIIRQIWIDGWDRGKKQCDSPYDYTLSDDKFLDEKWKELMKILSQICQETLKEVLPEEKCLFCTHDPQNCDHKLTDKEVGFNSCLSQIKQKAKEKFNIDV